MKETDALIGVSLLGLGSLLGYAAYKNVPVFGAQGLLTGALKTGKLQPVPSPGVSAPPGGGSPTPHPTPGPSPHS